MWNFFTSEQNKEFILSLDLIKDDISDTKKLNTLYRIANNSKKYYTPKYITKSDGSKRRLLVPCAYLKNIQRNILTNVLNDLQASPYVKSYLPHTSLKENAIPHVNQKIILKLDIKNFFPSISFEDLYKVLPNSIYPPSVKVLLLKLCTYDDSLPQGAPTSPMLSNLVLKPFDNYIGAFCKENNINYTRYSDDLTFSGNFRPADLIKRVKGLIEKMGYNLNPNKTKVISQNKRQIVTGLVVNKSVSVPSSYRASIRQEMYYIKKYGLDSHTKKLNLNKEQYLLSLKGRINYCLSINKDNKEFKDYQKYLQNIN